MFLKEFFDFEGKIGQKKKGGTNRTKERQNAGTMQQLERYYLRPIQRPGIYEMGIQVSQKGPMCENPRLWQKKNFKKIQRPEVLRMPGIGHGARHHRQLALALAPSQPPLPSFCGALSGLVDWGRHIPRPASPVHTDNGRQYSPIGQQ